MTMLSSGLIAVCWDGERKPLAAAFVVAIKPELMPR
jgi:hypothetical protein